MIPQIVKFRKDITCLINLIYLATGFDRLKLPKDKIKTKKLISKELHSTITT